MIKEEVSQKVNSGQKNNVKLEKPEIDIPSSLPVKPVKNKTTEKNEKNAFTNKKIEKDKKSPYSRFEGDRSVNTEE